MDKKILTKVIVLIFLIHLIIIVFYITSYYNPANQFAAYKDVTTRKARPAKYDLVQRQPMVKQILLGAYSGMNVNNASSATPGVVKEENFENTEQNSAPAEKIETNSPNLNHKPMRALTDTNHPQFHQAFARHTKPVYLLDWVPSTESHLYFQPISSIDARIYSAYFLDCAPPSVRLFALSARGKKHMGSVSCHFVDAQKEHMESQPGTLKALKDHHLLNYTAAAVDCQITPGLQPFYVSVTRNPDLDTSTNQVTIQYPGTQRRNFSMCFSPLHSNYNATFRLIQSIEFNRLLGASHFYFYNFSTSPQTDQILGQYEKEGLVTVLPWPLPHLETWYYGQILAINDCIYRNRMTSRFVVVVDTDEFIIPSRHSDWLELINDVIRSHSMREDVGIRSIEGQRECSVLPDTENKNNKNNKNATVAVSPSFGSFMFKCSFFAERYLDQNEQESIKSKNLNFTEEQINFFKTFVSQPMTYLKHNNYFFDYGRRSKLIVRPETVVSHAIHKTIQHISGFDTAYVNSTTAYLHHYRPFKIKQTSTLDISALRFKDKFYEGLKQAVGKFPTIFQQTLTNNLTRI